MQPKIPEHLAKRAKGRDPEAFEQLIQLCMPDMYRTALAILLNDEDAADAIQDAILACWEKIHTLKQTRYFHTWMTRILIRKCYDIRRARARFTDLEDIKEPSCEDSYNLELKEALSMLPEKYRLALTLYYGEGYSIREIADALRIPESTVQTQLKRGRDKLAKEYYGVRPKEQNP